MPGGKDIYRPPAAGDLHIVITVRSIRPSPISSAVDKNRPALKPAMPDEAGTSIIWTMPCYSAAIRTVRGTGVY